MTNNNVAIIGGGIGGLVTALLLTKKNINVTIYEKSSRLGGRLNFVEGSGFRIDQGPTIVLLPDMLLNILEEAGIDREQIQLLPCEPLYRIHYADGQMFQKYADEQQQYDEIERYFPGQAEQFTLYMQQMRQAYAKGKPAFLERAFVRKRDFYRIRNVRLLVQLQTFKSVHELASSYFASQKLIDAFSLQTLYIGGAPRRTPGLYSLVSFAEHEFGIWYLKGGYGSLIPILERELVNRGVTIHKKTRVEQIVTTSTRCKGVLIKGDLHAYDAIVYNGDFPTIQPLLPTVNVTRSKKFVSSSGCVLIYLGVNKRWEDTSTHQFFLPKSLDKSLQQIFDENKLADDPSFYVFNPTAIDDDAAPAGKSVLYMLVPVPNAKHVNWTFKTDLLVQRIIEQAEQRGFPGLREAIEWKQVRNPSDAQADGLYGGGSFGIAPTFMQSARFRPQIKPSKLDNLYAVGASVHPGGGVPIVMQGAKLLADLMEKELS